MRSGRRPSRQARPPRGQTTGAPAVEPAETCSAAQKPLPQRDLPENRPAWSSPMFVTDGWVEAGSLPGWGSLKGNSKHEIRNPKQTRNANHSNASVRAGFTDWLLDEDDQAARAGCDTRRNMGGQSTLHRTLSQAPHPNPLPAGEGGPSSARREAAALIPSPCGGMLFPLPAGEG